MLVAVDGNGTTAVMWAAAGHTEVLRVLLDHPSADAPAMLVATDMYGTTAVMWAVRNGQVDALRVLLDHPAADAAAMLVATDMYGATAVMSAVRNGQVDALRVLLEHPSADPAAMLVATDGHGRTAVMLAAGFASGQHALWVMGTPRSCAPLLFVLRRVAVEAQPSDDQQAHMTKVMEVLCQGPLSNAMFDNDTPDEPRDESVRLLLERGASYYTMRRSPVISRIIRECVQLASVPQRLHEAVVGVAIARKRPRDDARFAGLGGAADDARFAGLGGAADDARFAGLGGAADDA
jgi:hypothetical protein